MKVIEILNVLGIAYVICCNDKLKKSSESHRIILGFLMVLFVCLAIISDINYKIKYSVVVVMIFILIAYKFVETFIEQIKKWRNK